MIRDELSVLSAFLVVAEERNFTRAAKRLNVSKSGLSQAISRLEADIGVRLLSRTTRSVSATAAGDELLMSLRPALTEIRGKLTQISSAQRRPVGRIRLLVARLAVKEVLAPLLGAFAREYPDIVLDITTDDAHVDLAAAGYDAGIRLGEFIAQDMVAVRVSPDHRPAIVAAPSYFAAHGRPATPHDLLQHRCINFRPRGEGIYRWELDKGDHSVAVSVTGSLILDDWDLIKQVAVDGAGVAFMAEERARPHLDTGVLERVLEDWSPPFPGFFLYYPSRRQQSGALTALIEALRLDSRRSRAR